MLVPALFLSYAWRCFRDVSPDAQGTVWIIGPIRDDTLAGTKLLK
jgi:hypothetical protein